MVFCSPGDGTEEDPRKTCLCLSCGPWQIVGMQEEEKKKRKSELDVSSVRASWTCLLICLFCCVFLVSEKFSREFTIQHFMQRLS